MINLHPEHAESRNFLLRKEKKASFWKQKWFLGLMIGLGVVLLIVGGLTLRYLGPVRNLISEAKAGKDGFVSAQQAIANGQYKKAGEDLISARQNLLSAETNLGKLGSFRVLPYLKTQVSAIDNLFKAGIQTASALSKISFLADEIITPVKTDSGFTIAKLSRDQKHEILKKISESYPDLVGVKAEIDLAVLHLEQIPEKGVLQALKKIVSPIKEQLPSLKKSINQALPAAELLPPIAGYPEQQTYLFLLENNTELRPAGGFIGTYGILKIKDGEIDFFQTDNIYNLDNRVQNSLSIEPPPPLQKYLKAEKWFMRDSNWSPDFPTSAEKALWFYHQEGGPEPTIHGVVAVTPNFIESLLKLTGEIAINGITFNADNFLEMMQYQVEQGYYRQGISDADRKEVIGVLSQELLKRLLNFPQNRWGELWQVVMSHIEEKQLIFYSKNESLQAVIEQDNWGGQVRQGGAEDFVMFVDANLASLKTDRLVDRAVTYQVDETDDGLIADLTIKYENKGRFDWKSTRLRTYTRVYAPKGSQLLESSGLMTNDKLHNGKPTEAEVSEELDLAVFGGFLSIEPQESATLHYRYRLPKTLSARLKEGAYLLYFQKQAGTRPYPLTIIHNFKRNIHLAEPIDKIKITNNNSVTLSTDLRTDRVVEISFK